MVEQRVWEQDLLELPTAVHRLALGSTIARPIVFAARGQHRGPMLSSAQWVEYHKRQQQRQFQWHRLDLHRLNGGTVLAAHSE